MSANMSDADLPMLSPAAWRILRDHVAPNPPGVFDDVRATFAHFVLSEMREALARLDDLLHTPIVDRLGSIA